MASWRSVVVVVVTGQGGGIMYVVELLVRPKSLGSWQSGAEVPTNHSMSSSLNLMSSPRG